MSNANAKRSQMSPAARAVRAYVAPVGRPSGLIAPFDPAAQGQFDLDSPPAPWLDVGWVENLQRTAATKYESLRSGPVGNITVQYRTQPEARLEFDLPSWGKLQMALAGGTQTMNVLAALPAGQMDGSGGEAIPASPLQCGSSELALDPPCSGDAGIASPPEPSICPAGKAASTFIVCVPPARAICSLPHDGRSNSRRASGCVRYCTVMFPTGPLRSDSYLVAAVRCKFSTQPTSSHGAGGESRSNCPWAAGSKGAISPEGRPTGAT